MINDTSQTNYEKSLEEQNILLEKQCAELEEENFKLCKHFWESYFHTKIKVEDFSTCQKWETNGSLRSRIKNVKYYVNTKP